MINVINDRNISFRLANSSDFEYVKNLLTEGVEEGHYLKTLIENEEKFIEAMTDKLCDYKIGKSTEKSGFLTVEEYSWIMKKDMIIIYQFIITKETAKNYILTRDKLIYAKYNPINDRYKVNFETVFKPIVIPKNEDNEDFNVGEKIIIINYKENIINGRNFKSICYEGLYAVKAKDFLNQYKDHIENDKRINLCTKQDIEKIRDYFIQVLSKKNSNNSSSLNEKRKLKIKELEDQYYSISIPTHEDLLNICEKIDLNSPFFIIEDYNRKYALYRQLGKIKIERWKQCQKLLPFGKDLPLPHIVFYE